MHLLNGGADLTRYAGIVERLSQQFTRFTVATVALAEDYPAAVGVCDDSWCSQLCADINNRRQDLIRVKNMGQLVWIIDAVLERENTRPLCDQRFELFSGGFGIIRLDTTQNQIHRPNSGSIVGEESTLHLQIAIGAYDVEAVCIENLQVSTAGDESDIMPSSRELRAEIAPHRSCTHDRDAH